ncbi:Uncharacterized spore protein YtfJ [Peptoclostridium litorale DSM 5388]|uniref:Sporulation protein YtfJ n=1 Tax=Peptoclostridium litorale DSM 5388 TaxID=1121324 RepID=A0A069RH24_PEPLI|nr:spore germination protein GerW family protein [Peptoclostridium litorale]KDR95470.1 hypothetical protein CLIT_10c01970 [Peptoclostridium litorale DSM 5388]SIO18013.1 Uncharacterized spore protein YtfJ [Peptoclostridium litorale DSM 5388]
MAFDFSENVNALFERFEKFFTSKTVVGESIQVGDITLIPLMSISFGLGTGGGTDPKGNQGEGGGGGIGAKASPTAIIVIKGGDVQVVSVGAPHGFEKLVEMVPEVVSKVMGEEKEEVKETKEHLE